LPGRNKKPPFAMVYTVAAKGGAQMAGNGVPKEPGQLDT
jgi:hypothetical protein